jgi:pimeloyl-ACP methyl ester carboxylesterase
VTVRRALAALVALLTLLARPASAQEVVGESATAATTPIVFVFIAGYGTNLATVSRLFAPLQSALAARNPNASFVRYSYTGTTFNGCGETPSAYRPSDTAQDIEVSKRILRESLSALQDACEVDRIVIVGHSLGGLIAFQALGEQPAPRVSDVVTVDSPLGGVPLPLIRSCIDVGLCAEGAVVAYLVDLYAAWAGTATDNAAREAALTATGTRVTAWGNQSDCYYAVALCNSFSRTLLAGYDARQTQWLGIARTVHKDYPFAAYAWNIPPSHTAVLRNSATEMAADLLP